ncbi:hypothetical protein [Urbifossiella limnaea]|uniref:Uncharacterized protein n=1 Tax=Urbifossiella limnaea TaxID=2528023 RepID=A0A517XQK2_9BACT|nr:hypothetical protein [Urbifossiella limnaea]QDU19787.1 hypothetical protein ETAA1_17250 [Urbifossiella limnaea]
MSGTGTGFTHRLPGTGAGLPASDPNLRLVLPSGRLEVTATGSDLNTLLRLEQAEFPGVRLADLGFTGGEDFEVAAEIRGDGLIVREYQTTDAWETASWTPQTWTAPVTATQK